MKSKLYIFIAVLTSVLTGMLPAMGQKSGPVNDTVLIGSNNEVYYNLAAGNKTAVNRKQWDIAFRASRMSASILTNDAVGVELYTYPKADTNGWLTMDTTGFYTWKNMVNSSTDWETGAFCQNQSGHPDYGWGKYNSVSHNVVGDSLFIIRLRDGSLRKIWIVEKFSSDNIFKIRFANMNGSADTTVLVDCSPGAVKNFVGYSISTKQVVDFEPVATSQWDILFTKYMYTYPDGAMQPVTGVLSNYGIKVNKFQHVAPDYRIWDLASMDSTRSPIGFDWKTYDYANNVYIIEDSLVYFIQDQSGNIQKLIFKEYTGGSSGKFVFEREMISALSVSEIEKSEMNAAVYPNPVSDVMNVVINPGKTSSVEISVYDIAGRLVFDSKYTLQANVLSTLQVPLPEIPAGNYVVRIQADKNILSRKVIVRK